MTTGGYVRHCEKYLSVLADRTVLIDCGFLIPKDKKSVNAGDYENDVILENEFADTFGQMQLHVIRANAKRGLWYQA